jgi:ubiquitin-conjugating enzyme E2 D/E
MWGEACGFRASAGYDQRLDEPSLKCNIESTLSCIKGILSIGATVIRKYDLAGSQDKYETIVPEESNRARWSLTTVKERLVKGQKRLNIKEAAKWALADKKKLDTLVRDLSDLIGDLERFTRDLGIYRRQQILVQYEIESISDVPTLEMMEASRISPTDGISDAASARLKSLRDPSEAQLRNPELSSTLGSGATLSTYVTAPEKAVLSSDRVSSSQLEIPRPEESNIRPPDPPNSNLSQNRRIMNDLLTRVSPNTSISQIKPIDTSSVGNMISSLRHERMDEVPVNYPASLLRTSLRRPTAQRPQPDSIGTSSTRSSTIHTERRSVQYSSASTKRMFRELQDIKRSPEQFVHVRQIGSSLRVFLGSMEGPPGTPFHGGIFHIVFLLPRDYPFKPPHCRFITKIYHPNIDTHGRICLDILTDHWGPSMTLARTLISIVSLLDDPGLDEPLVPEIAELYIRYRSQYEETARSYTQKHAMQLVPTREMVDGCLQDLARQAEAYENDVFQAAVGSNIVQQRPPTLASLFLEGRER